MILNINVSAIIGSVLAGLRAAAGITQAQLGQRAGLTGAQISEYERSIVAPGLDSAIRIMQGMGWAVCAIPEPEARTYEQREAVIEAAIDCWRAGGLNLDEHVTLSGAVDQLLLDEQLNDPPAVAAVDPITTLRKRVEWLENELRASQKQALAQGSVLNRIREVLP